MGAVVDAAVVPDPHALELWLRVNGEERQRGSTGDMLARVPQLLEEVSAVMTLQAGDVVLTGTPHGVGPVLPGQVITAGVTGMPAFDLRFPVVQGP
jgi:acylpyruvate hydrolase